MKDWKKLESELLKDPAVKAEVDRLDAEYQLARQLIKARLAKKLTQTELAERAGVKQEYIARLESGTANPTVGNLNKVADVLGKRVKLVGVS
ncbi:MAG: helix-turn-helix transcriptional regulator [Candidatus Saccharibacteria bacterium]